MPAVPTAVAATFARHGHAAIALLLACAFVSGGGSMDRGLFDVATQLLALPLLAWAALALHGMLGSALRRVAVGLAVAIAALVALQQLPLGQGAWQAIDARRALGMDLALAGVSDARHAWALSPLAAERGLWSLLPALAVFLGVLALPAARHRALLLLAVGLTAASLLLGYLQLGAPQDSLLNPFPQWAPALNGVFASPNHQASALALAVVAIAALLLVQDPRLDDATSIWQRAGLVTAATLLFASLPLTGSRAALLICVMALVGTVATAFRPRGREQSPRTAWRWRSRGALFALGGIGVAAIAASFNWLRWDMEEEVRWNVANATFGMGLDLAPAGAGLGSFVPWFDQAATGPLVQWSYYNHAHNEYAQWWLESGVPGVLLVLAAMVLLAWCLPRRSRADSADFGAALAAWGGVVILLLHSIVDYPLRTPALMTVAALLAGIVVAQRLARDGLRPRDARAASVRTAPQRA